MYTVGRSPVYVHGADMVYTEGCTRVGAHGQEHPYGGSAQKQRKTKGNQRSFGFRTSKVASGRQKWCPAREMSDSGKNIRFRPRISDSGQKPQYTGLIYRPQVYRPQLCPQTGSPTGLNPSFCSNTLKTRFSLNLSFL